MNKFCLYLIAILLVYISLCDNISIAKIINKNHSQKQSIENVIIEKSKCKSCKKNSDESLKPRNNLADLELIQTIKINNCKINNDIVICYDVDSLKNSLHWTDSDKKFNYESISALNTSVILALIDKINILENNVKTLVNLEEIRQHEKLNEQKILVMSKVQMKNFYIEHFHRFIFNYYAEIIIILLFCIISLVISNISLRRLLMI